jgi:pimeloyl-ACP methyl ester carboxylesterase
VIRIIFTIFKKETKNDLFVISKYDMNNDLNQSVLINQFRIATGVYGLRFPVVFIHGTPSHSYIWRNVWPIIAEAKCKVHLFDLLGFGSSERPQEPDVDTSVAAQADLLLQLMLRWNLPSANIVAHDIGGAIAMRFAIRHPEKVHSLTLLDTVSYDSWPSETWKEIIDQGLDAMIRSSEDEHKERMINQFKMVVYDKSKMEGEVLSNYLNPVTGPLGQPSFFQHQVRYYNSRYTEEITEQLNELGKIPVQIIWGENDEWQDLTYAHQLSNDVAGSMLHVIPGAGHFVMEDKPEKVAGIIQKFILDQY